MDKWRQRLQRLNRASLPGQERRDSDTDSPPKDTGAADSGPPDVSLETLVPGEIVADGGGTFYCVPRCVSDVWAPGAEVFTRLTEAVAMTRDAPGDGSTHVDLVNVVAAGLRSLLFVDLETCGFSGTPVFLIGAMVVDADGLRSEQLLARSYADEAAIVKHLAGLVAEHPHLVTFNGKSFDWPFLADRAAIHHVALPSPTGHCDLLHPSRRRFGGMLPNCKLQTLEQFICGRKRVGDIPGSEIPAAYHDFVRTADARQMRDIIRHNFLDLVTMADILAALLR